MATSHASLQNEKVKKLRR